MPRFALVFGLAIASIASAQEPSPSPSPSPIPALSAIDAPAVVVPRARLRGRVFLRGSIAPIAGARIVTADGRAVTDDQGNFELDLPPGKIEVLISADAHKSLRVSETLEPGQGLTVEYRLLGSGRRKYESTVVGQARHEGERFTLKDEELHQLPGGLGDPFRAVGMLPGVAQPITLLPLYVIRGASPGMNGFILDGMRVPQLFHFMVGGGVVHARLIDRLDFYPGAYDVSFGRFGGGIIDSETRGARTDAHHGEVEIRVYDVSALLEFVIPTNKKNKKSNPLRLVLAGHYGWPGPIVSAIDDRVADLSYWDYQLRLDWKGLTVELLGSYDALGIYRNVTRMGVTRRVADESRITFHRLQVRDRERFGRVELEAALVGGIDQAAGFAGTGVQKLSLGGRILLSSRWNRFRLFLGVDGEVSRFEPSNFGSALPGQQPDQLGDLGGVRDGVVAGAFVQGTVELIKKRLDLTAGVRADVYHAGRVTVIGVDPRLQLKATLQPWLKLNAGVGLYQQPPSFPVLLPGLDTFSLQLGLQRAIHAATGIEAALPQSFNFTITGFYQRFYNINDVLIDFGPAICTSPPPESITGVPSLILRQVDGHAYGMEMLLRRTAGRFTGWIAYTLSRSERVVSCGLRPADFDQTHILNIVLQVRLPWNLMVGTRLYVATGRPVTILEPPDGRSTVRNNTRLPDFVQLDLRIDREWIFKSWALAVFIEALNLTYSESVIGIQYPEVEGIPNYLMPQYNGFRWILPSVGIRGRY